MEAPSGAESDGSGKGRHVFREAAAIDPFFCNTVSTLTNQRRSVGAARAGDDGQWISRGYRFWSWTTIRMR